MNRHDERSIEDKIKLLAGSDFWHTAELEGVESITMSDGPHGLRKQTQTADNLGLNGSEKAICFPSAGCVACSFDHRLVGEMGELLGDECSSEDVDILLAPAVNIKRSPLCGRNFEYYSEDPCLAGELGASFVKGLESRGVGACVKHYAMNNQETARMSVSADADERTMREIYLNVFERIMRVSPRAVMSSYNLVNGEYVGESERLLDKILRKEWGFDGIVISDWYAVNDRVKALKAGLDLEMPGGALTGGDKITAAYKAGEISQEVIDKSYHRIVREAKGYAKRDLTEAYDKDYHHAQAVKIATESAVLLKNDNDLLPINKGEKILFVGRFAKKPRYQGGGSSHVNAYYAGSVTEYCTGYNVDYIDGYLPNGDVEEENLSNLLELAKKYDKVLIFAGLNESDESEGYDRLSLELPKGHNRLIDELCNVNEHVGVVLFNGSPVTMPWKGKVKAILEMYLAGEGAGEACAKLLIGEANPCGRLAESFPECIEHNPSYLNYPGGESVEYREGVFVGYRYYTTKNIRTLFPFGHGLSYTDFKYSNLVVTNTIDGVDVGVDITNIGSMSGKEVVQVYISPPPSKVQRPIRELKAFTKIELMPDEVVRVNLSLSHRDFAYFDNNINDWRVQGGEYVISLNRSAEECILSKTVTLKGDKVAIIEITDNTTLAQLYEHPATRHIIEKMISGYSMAAESEAISGEMKYAMMLNAPLRLVKGVSAMSEERYLGLKALLNEAMHNYEIN